MVSRPRLRNAALKIAASATQRRSRRRWPPSCCRAPGQPDSSAAWTRCSATLPRPAARDRDPDARSSGAQRHPWSRSPRRLRVRGLIGANARREIFPRTGPLPMLERPALQRRAALRFIAGRAALNERALPRVGGDRALGGARDLLGVLSSARRSRRGCPAPRTRRCARDPRVVELHVHAPRVDVDDDHVAVVHARDRTAAAGLGRDVAGHEAARRAAEAAVGDQGDALAEARAMIAAVTASISRMPGPPRALVADDDDVAGLDAASDGLPSRPPPSRTRAPGRDGSGARGRRA